MTKKIIQEAKICAITLLNAKKVNEYQWIGASNGSLDGNLFMIYVVFDGDTEDYYLQTASTKIQHFSINDYDWPLDAGLSSLAKLISSKIKVSIEDAEKCIFAARALIEDEADEIDEMEFVYTLDNELGDINPSKFFSGESEVINRVWMGIGMNQNADKVELDLSTGLLDFDREALDDIRICAWSRFNV